MNARYYGSNTNRWLSPDTIVPDREDPQSFNRYSYVRNNPVKFVDSDGHCWGFASGIRNWNFTIGGTTYGGGVNCANIDMALSIVQHPDATPEEKAQAGAYLGGWGVAAVTGGAGGGLLVCSTVAPCATIAETVLGIGTAAASDGDPTNEYHLLLDRVMSLRSRFDIGWQRNVATANYQIGGNSGTLNAVSGEAPRGAEFVEITGQRFFTTGATQAFDSEVKILESLANQYASNPSVQGTVKLFTERPPCDSCWGVIQQFEAMFPNLLVEIITEITYYGGG